MVSSNFLLISWYEFHEIYRSIFGCDFNSIEDVNNYLSDNNTVCEWAEIDNWEELDDVEILETISLHRIFSDDLYLLAESSYKNSPYKTSSSLINRFISEHLELFNECFFNGDVLILNKSSKEVWLFHHEGVYTNFKLS